MELIFFFNLVQISLINYFSIIYWLFFFSVIHSPFWSSITCWYMWGLFQLFIMLHWPICTITGDLFAPAIFSIILLPDISCYRSYLGYFWLLVPSHKFYNQFVKFSEKTYLHFYRNVIKSIDLLGDDWQYWLIPRIDAIFTLLFLNMYFFVSLGFLQCFSTKFKNFELKVFVPLLQDIFICVDTPYLVLLLFSYYKWDIL